MNNKLNFNRLFYTVCMALVTTIAIVGFQNCSGTKLNFSGGGDSTGQAEMSSNSTSDGSSPSSINSMSVAAGAHKIGERYGSCAMQIDHNFQIAHNGEYYADGTRIATVPQGVGGATWPVIDCPKSGNYKTVDVKCAEGFKSHLTQFTQMDCRSSASAATCNTYWAIFSCIKLAEKDGTAAASEKSLKWVYTEVKACIGPTPAPAIIGSACSPSGRTASNDCGTATCQLQ